MSLDKNQNLRFWQDVVAKLRRNRYQISVDTQGCDLDGVSPRQDQILRQQTETIADGYGLMLMTWTDLMSSPLTPPQVHNLVNILTTVPVSEVVTCLKECDELLIEEIQKEHVCTFSDFKHQIAGRWPSAVGLIAPTRGLWMEMRESENRALAARDLHTAYSFITRLNIPGREDLQHAARQKFLEREDLLSNQWFYTTDERDVLSCWFPNSVSVYEQIYGDWKPGHGKGSVADTREVNLAAKYHALGRDEGTDYLDLLTGGLGYPRPRLGFARTAKVIFVPKSVSKLRTICMEPATLMFYQQGFLRSIVRYISHHRYLRRRIDLAHPSKNVALALEGSESGKYATIDLSDASDSVSWRMVRQWFADTPLMPILEHARSSRYFLDGEVRESLKFAPMGSSLCFPIMCLVFTAICEATIRQSGGSPRTSNYRVYGDDIIIESRYATALIERLEANGFSVNRSKSFTQLTSHLFRESCGGEFLDGYPIGAFRIPRKFSGMRFRSSASRSEGLMDLANDCYYHLPTARMFIVSELLKAPKQFRPLFCEGYQQGGLISDQPTNFHLEQRYAANYQRIQLRHGASPALQGVIADADEDIRYYEWLRSMSDRPLDAELSESRVFIDRSPSVRSHEADLIASVWT